MARNSLSKKEKLKSRKSIEFLFRTGRSLSSPPLRMLYSIEPSGHSPVQVAVIVPKRFFKRAVDRNLLKRRIRESYRKSKTELLELADRQGISIKIAIIYNAAEIKDSRRIANSLKSLQYFLLKRLKES